MFQRPSIYFVRLQAFRFECTLDLSFTDELLKCVVGEREAGRQLRYVRREREF